jgi:hypothetical protein
MLKGGFLMKVYAEKNCATILTTFLSICLTMFLLSCESINYAGLPQGDPASGYDVTGFISAAPGSAAPGQIVTLVDITSGKTVGSVQTNYMGKYTFYPVKPGSYQVNVKSIKLPVAVTTNHVRLDMDLSSPDGRMDYLAAALKQHGTAQPSGAIQGKSADDETSGLGLSAAAPTGDADGQLQQLLLSSAWCSFSYSKSAGVTKHSRAQFFPNGTYTLKLGSEGYYSGPGGTYSSQDKRGGGGRWQVRGGQLFISEGRGPLEPVNLKVTYNNNGVPILIADGVEYFSCK